MKKLITVFLFLFILASQSYSGSFYLSMYDDSEFFASFNNTQMSTPVRYAEFSVPGGGRNYLTVYRQSSSSHIKPSIIFEGYINIPQGYDVYGVIDESNNFVIYKKVREQVIQTNNGCNCSCEGCKNCMTKSNTEWGYDCGTIGGRDFSDLKKLINGKSFESTKIDIAKSGIDMNYFKAEQVKELLQLFTFESSKVELAKYAFIKTCDRNVYFKIYDVFTFESSISEIENYIKGKK